MENPDSQGIMQSQASQEWEQGAMYNYHRGVHEVFFFFKKPNPLEVLALDRGLLRFGLYIQDEVIMLLCKSDGPNGLPGILWHDMPYSYHLVPEQDRVLPILHIPPNLGIVITVHLVDVSGIVLTGRSVNLSHHFTMQLHQAIHKQAQMPFNKDAYFQKVQSIYAQYPTPMAVAQVAMAKCIGGINESG